MLDYFVVSCIILLLLSSKVFSLSSKPFNQYEQFEFATNGVCIKPHRFVAVASGLTSSDVATATAVGATATTTITATPRYFTMRNVPGDGDCMFQATALAAATSLGLGANMALLRMIAKETRLVVASVLESDGNLYIEQSRLIPAKQLLRSAAKLEGLTPEDYLELLRREGIEGGLYGGGPELTVLSNVLRRPISIYELDEQDTSLTASLHEDDQVHLDSCCRIVCKGVFGEPIFQDPCLTIPNSAILSDIQPGAYSWHLHILVLNVGKIKHACVLLPQSPV